MDDRDDLDVYRTALEQIERLMAAGGMTVLINGQRYAPNAAIPLIIRWAQQGVTASEILLCEPAGSEIKFNK